MTHVMIVGAGPAGVAAAVCLTNHGVSHTVLEAADRPFAATRTLDPDLPMVSPARLSTLPGMRIPRGEASYLTFRRWLELAELYRAEQNVEVVTGARVDRVERDGAGFRVCSDVRGERRIDRCDAVISCAGVLGRPRLPRAFEPDACSIAWRHSRDVRAADLEASRDLLVVGGGVSAAEVVERYLALRRPGDRCSLSLRSPLLVSPRYVAGIDVHYLAWLPEHVPARLPGLRRLLHREPAVGTGLRRALRDETVASVPGVATVRGGEVVLDGGERVAPDLIVFATGYTYGAAHLGDLVDCDERGVPYLRDCESPRAPGLYLLGARFARNLASPFLRGISADARFVAGRIARRARR